MKQLWDELEKKYRENTASNPEQEMFKKLVNCLKKLTTNPRYPGLHSHDIESLTKRYGIKVWESYLENNKPAAGRIFWVYGPEKADITVIGLEPHPNDKKDAYKKVTILDRTLCPAHPVRRIFFCLAVFVERRRIDRYRCPYFQGESVMSLAA